MDDVEGILDLGKQDSAFSLTPRAESPIDYRVTKPAENPPSPRHSSTPVSTKSSPRSNTSSFRYAPTPQPPILIPKPKVSRANMKTEHIDKIRYGTVPQRIVRPMKDHPVKLNIKPYVKTPEEEEKVEEPKVEEEKPYVDLSTDTLDTEQLLERMLRYGGVRRGPWRIDGEVNTEEAFPEHSRAEVCDVESQSESPEMVEAEMQCEEYVQQNEDLLAQIEELSNQINLLSERLKTERMKHGREINFMEERYDALLHQLSMKVPVADSTTNTEIELCNAHTNTEPEPEKETATASVDTSSLISVRNQSVETKIRTKDQSTDPIFIITNSKAINTDGGSLRNTATSTADLVRTSSIAITCDIQPPEPVRIYTPPMPTEITPPQISPISFLSADTSMFHPDRSFSANLLPRSPPPIPMLNRATPNYTPASHSSPIRYHSPTKIRSPSPTNQYQEPSRGQGPTSDIVSKQLSFFTPDRSIRETSPPRIPKTTVSFADIIAPSIEEKPKKVKKTKKKVKTKEEKEAKAIEKARKAQLKLEKYLELKALQEAADRTLIERTLRKKPEKEKRQDGVYFVYVDPQTKVLMPDSSTLESSLLESKKLKSKSS